MPDASPLPGGPSSPAAGPDPYPLSPLQQGMLFHWLIDRHAGTDFQQAVVDLHEVIDPARLQRAWQNALATFSTLRTAFAWESLATPLQHVEPTADLVLGVEDLRSLPSETRAARLLEYLRSDRNEGFDLTICPAMRVRLFQLEDEYFQMIWSYHHILIDGRAAELVLDFVFAGYAGEPPGKVDDRPFREYVEWIGREDLGPSRDFWRAQLRGFTATTPIPSDHPPRDRERFGIKWARLSPEATARLRDLASRDAVSLNVLTMSAWALLLSRYSGERDIVFGAARTTRRGAMSGARSMIGVFVTTIPMRVPVTPDLTVGEWLKRVRAHWQSLRGAEHLPLVEIRQTSELPPTAQLFDSMILYEDQQVGTRFASQGGAWANRWVQIRGQTGFPLALYAFGENPYAFRIEYDARRFDEATIDRMVGHLTTVLEAWGRDTSGPLWATPILSAGERKTIVEDWNDTAREYPEDVSLASLVEAQVGRTPDASAVTCGSETITYAELNVRANRLARELLRRGAGPDRLIGLAVERSIEMLVGLLAVIKAGAAYLPLDPAFPRDRLAYMMEDSRLGILVTQRRVAPSLPAFGGVVIEIDAISSETGTDRNPGIAVDPESLAYVIYTSGSTGRPKGVQIRRRALTNFLWAMRELLSPGSADRLLAVTTLSFDIAGLELWLPLLTGAEVVVARREAAADGFELHRLIDRHAITMLQATPVTWRLLLEAGWPGKSEMQAICGGEALPPELAAELVPRVRRLWNLYGPTETTVWSTGVEVRGATEPISIGRPIANTQCYILDEYGQPVPAGVTGELFIAGAGLARGYLKQPELDQEKFVTNPFAGTPDPRMYRTGDRARFGADGTIEYLGRADDQVKMRGFRIEPGEIESALQAHPSVRQAVVVAREDRPGDRRLVGYIVPEQGPIDVAGLRSHLRLSLPEYMVPSAFVTLQTLPLTANGKVDRRALPAPEAGAALPEAGLVAARTHVEKQLSEIWQELFGVPVVGVLENFFDLGGHSMLAVKMMARISRVLGKQLPLNALFESPTIAQLAKHIEDADRTVGRHTVVTIQATGTRLPIFWIPGGAALGLFGLSNILTRLGPDQPVYGLGSTNTGSLDDVETVEERAESYLELVRRVQPQGPYCFAGFCAGGRIAYEMAQQVSAAGGTVAFLTMINTPYSNYPFGPFDRMLLKAQRIRHQIRAARSTGVGLAGYVRSKIAERRRTALERRALAQAALVIRETGLQLDASSHNQLLLLKTIEVHGRYRPRPYTGHLSLFISDEEIYRGVSRRLDARLGWAPLAGTHEIRAIPGDHVSVLDGANVGALTEGLKAVLEEALDRYRKKAGGRTRT